MHFPGLMGLRIVEWEEETEDSFQTGPNRPERDNSMLADAGERSPPLASTKQHVHGLGWAGLPAYM